MLLESLGFSPDGDPLALYEGKRPDLRIKDLPKRAGETVELVVRVVDARGKETNGGLKYFYFFEDETGILEGVGGRKCLTIGEPPVCCSARRGPDGRPGDPEDLRLRLHAIILIEASPFFRNPSGSFPVFKIDERDMPRDLDPASRS